MSDLPSVENGEGFLLPRAVPDVDELRQLEKLKVELLNLEGTYAELKAQEQQGTYTSLNIASALLRTHAGLDAATGHGSNTPQRFVAMLDELTQCKDCEGQCMKWKTFESDVDQMIVVSRIPFSSVCNHHVVPFVGHAWIGYIPDGAIAGLSKFARVVHHFAHRLQVQEELTDQVAYFLEKELVPKGVMVVMEAEHLCMTIRGVQTPGTTTRTVVTTGVFADHNRTAKAEFLMGIK